MPCLDIAIGCTKEEIFGSFREYNMPNDIHSLFLYTIRKYKTITKHIYKNDKINSMRSVAALRECSHITSSRKRRRWSAEMLMFDYGEERRKKRHHDISNNLFQLIL